MFLRRTNYAIELNVNTGTVTVQNGNDVAVLSLSEADRAAIARIETEALAAIRAEHDIETHAIDGEASLLAS